MVAAALMGLHLPTNLQDHAADISVALRPRLLGDFDQPGRQIGEAFFLACLLRVARLQAPQRTATRRRGLPAPISDLSGYPLTLRPTARRRCLAAKVVASETSGGRPSGRMSRSAYPTPPRVSELGSVPN